MSWRILKITGLSIVYIVLFTSSGQNTISNKEVAKQSKEDFHYWGTNDIIRSISCAEKSAAMLSIIEILKQDNYSITSIESKEALLFMSKSEENISFPENSFQTFYVKRKNKLKKENGNWYPSFSVTEICLKNEQIASEKYQEISKIIQGIDRFNEKNYDYILKNGSRLIYVSCRANIFLKYAFSYKEKIRKIIEKKNTH